MLDRWQLRPWEMERFSPRELRRLRVFYREMVRRELEAAREQDGTY